MARLTAAILGLLLCTTGLAGAQTLQAYAFAGPGTVLSVQNEPSTHYGGGVSLIGGRRFGGSLELGETTIANLVLANVSIDGIYHWSAPHRRVEPFAVAGYSRFYARAFTLQSFNVGGGAQVWTHSGVAIRFEVRDHVYPRLGHAQALSFRAGVAIRLTDRLW